MTKDYDNWIYETQIPIFEKYTNESLDTQTKLKLEIEPGFEKGRHWNLEVESSSHAVRANLKAPGCVYGGIIKKQTTYISH